VYCQPGALVIVLGPLRDAVEKGRDRPPEPAPPRRPVEGKGLFSQSKWENIYFLKKNFNFVRVPVILWVKQIDEVVPSGNTGILFILPIGKETNTTNTLGLPASLPAQDSPLFTLPRPNPLHRRDLGSSVNC